MCDISSTYFQFMKITLAGLLTFLLLAACSEESSPAGDAAAAGATPDAAQGVPGRVYQTTLENVPDWVPLPDEFTVIMDSGRGVGNIVIEVPGDMRAVVEKMNAHLSTHGLKQIEEKASEDGRYMAQGVISDRTKGMAVINIGEYDGPESSYKPGNVGSISYMITGAPPTD